MKLLRTLVFVATAFYAWSHQVQAGEKVDVPWVSLAKRTDIHFELKSNGRDQLTAVISNHPNGALALEVPAGLVCELGDRTGRIVSLRAAPVTIEAGGAVEVDIPSAALSAKNGTMVQACVATRDRVPKLQALLTWLAQRSDVPRATSQIAVLSLMEDVSFSQWQAFALNGLPGADPAAHPTLSEVVQAVDALAILREVAPRAALELTKDSELKLRALRNPLCRAKAAELYGLELPPATAGATKGPNLSQLLHHAPNDNCPICRARSRAQQSSDGM